MKGAALKPLHFLLLALCFATAAKLGRQWERLLVVPLAGRDLTRGQAAEEEDGEDGEEQEYTSREKRTEKGTSQKIYRQGGVNKAQYSFVNFNKDNVTVSFAMTAADLKAYQAGYRSFAERWKAAIARWEAKAAPLKGVPVLVQHDAFPYLNAWLGLKQVGVLEQKPGMEPSSGYLAEVLARQQHNPGRMVLRPAYQYDAPSRWIADKAGIPAVILPFTVGGTAEAKDLFSLFDDTVNRLLAALR